MAATNLFRLYSFYVFVCFCPYFQYLTAENELSSKFHYSTTLSKFNHRHLFNELRYLFFTCLCRPSFVSSRLISTGFHKTSFAAVKYSKHGFTSLCIPGHDPPLDIVICMDVNPNPGPSISTPVVPSGRHSNYADSQYSTISKLPHPTVTSGFPSISLANNLLFFIFIIFIAVFKQFSKFSF